MWCPGPWSEGSILKTCGWPWVTAPAQRVIHDPSPSAFRERWSVLRWIGRLLLRTVTDHPTKPHHLPESILILDHGSQYTQLIARRVRELNVYCEIHPFSKAQDLVGDPDVKGVILSGSPSSVHEAGAPDTDLHGFIGRLPVLAICYGAQLLAKRAGAPVERSKVREYGRARLTTISDDHLFDGIGAGSQVWMSHADTITAPSEAMEVIASTEDVAVAAYRLRDAMTYAVQFHPEVYHSTDGLQL
ncbi:MAG: glutamine-hydrolyzing GMP synthase, partial [Flavobacteriales bacterium]|nr:glutamine-hydrolyzing GMP synthase [Flavobacteriales bacterium]